MHDLLIVGAGPVGMALALAMRDSGRDIALADARGRGAGRHDPRVLALAHGTRLTLERLGVWDRLAVTPIRSIHVSQAGGFGRTRLEASDHGLPALGYVTRAGALASALEEAVAEAAIPFIEHARLAALAPGDGELVARFEGAASVAVRARLVACAEGGMDPQDPGVSVRDYGQHALISIATPQRDHQGLAYERFTPGGPLALLPCGTDYAIVHTAGPTEAERLLALPDAEYLDELERQLGGRVRFERVEPRLRFPLALRYRRHPVGERTVWLGNAAQTLHPVAGQGFNLALRDVWALSQALLADDGDPGREQLLRAYADARRLDRSGTIGLTDSLVRLFSNELAPLRQLRGAALLALDMLPPLRGFLARRMMFGARAWP